MGNNSVLIAVAVLERIQPELKSEKRVQLNRTNLTVIKQTANQAITNLMNANFRDDVVFSNLLATINIVDALLADEQYDQTDQSTKEELTDRMTTALNVLYLKAGQYYETTEFDYDPRMYKILTSIVDECIKQGYYFGIDKEIVE